MTTAEITAYLYGAKLAREQAWMGPGELAAIERIGLKRFNHFMWMGHRGE